MEFRVLGPLEVLDERRPIDLAGKQRALLAVLLVHANEVVSTDRLIDALWGDQPPATAQTALQVHVSQLRKLLGAERIETRVPGYRLVVAPEELDRLRFERLLAEGRAEEALALWRGRPFVEFEYEPWALGEVARLEELRFAAEEERFEAALKRGKAPVGELEALVRSQPLRERPRAQLMRALYSAGRQADALALYQETRRTLVEELGIEPGPELQGLYKQILNQDPALAKSEREEAPPLRRREERKVVTVLFCDLVGFTPRAEEMDPEDVSALLSRFHVRLRAELERFGGTVEKFAGDAVMALFGAPVAHEDDAERAVRAALAIRDWIAEAEDDLQVRIGVSTGVALVRISASPADGEAMAVGDVVNTAARLEQVTPQGAILVGEQTYRATRKAIVYERVDPVEVKGKSEPVAVWIAKGVREAIADTERPTTPFVGRNRELMLLQQTYERTLNERSAQLVTIVGEPGIGKTRLLMEFRSLVENDDVFVRHGRCLAYGDGITFWALGQIVKEQAGILESDTPEVAAEKLASTLAAVAQDSDRQWLFARLAPLVGAARQETTAEQEESFAAWRTFLESLAAQRPLVLLVEDLHWADNALLEFVEGLVEWVTDVPLLVVGTARPELFERAPGWSGGQRNATTLALGPLSNDETSAVVAELLPDTILPEETRALLLDTAGGNPLYAEEFVRLVVDRGADDIAVPEGVHAVIAARLDTLAPERKELIQAAAVVGKVFWAGVLAAMTHASRESVLANLHELGRKELVRRIRTSSIADDVEYLFWHVLVRDVAYEQIPRAERARLHVAAAEWIERIGGERVTDHAEFLAHHYRTALAILPRDGADSTIEDSAIHWSIRAGDRAFGLNLDAARPHYERALEMMRDNHPERPRVLLELMHIGWSGGGADIDEAKRLYDEALAAYRARGDDRGAGDAMRRFYEDYWVRGEGAKAREVIDEAVHVLEPLGPTPELAYAYASLALQLTLEDRTREAAEYASRALGLAERFELWDCLISSRQELAFARLYRGDPTNVKEELLQSAQDAQRYGIRYQEGTAYNALGVALRWTEGPAASLEMFNACAEIAKRAGLARPEFWNRAASTAALYALGRWDELLELSDRVVAWDDEHGSSLIRYIVLPRKARVLAERGDLAAAKELVDEFLQPCRDSNNPGFIGEALSVAALVEQQTGNLDAAVAYLEEFLKMAADSPGSLGSWVEVATDVARSLAAVGHVDPGRSLPALGALPLEVLISDTVRAITGERQAQYDEADRIYADLVTRWRAFGNFVEHAHALAGVARCRIALGRAEEAEGPIREARAIFEGLGAQSWLAELQRLSASAVSATAQT